MLKIFDALMPYFGGKRELCPVIFNHITRYCEREFWWGSTFVDAFMGSGAVSLYAKSQGFRILANDIAERSVIAGQALIENNNTPLTVEDLHRLYVPNPENNTHLIERQFSPDVFPKRHAIFLDNAFANAKRPIDKYLLMKYIFRIRPYSKFSSPNAFNRPFENGSFDQIKPSYTKHIKDNLKGPMKILRSEMSRINAGIFSNGKPNKMYKEDVLTFVRRFQDADILYLDPPYAGTLSYENEYGVLDKILSDEKVTSRFSTNEGMDFLEEILANAEKYWLWIISFGNAAGKNYLEKLQELVRKFRNCSIRDFEYRHCEAMASEEHKRKSREWVVFGWKWL